jgi:hypothetical protein
VTFLIHVDSPENRDVCGDMQEPVSTCKRPPAIDQMFLGFRDRTNRFKIKIEFVEAKKIATNDTVGWERLRGALIVTFQLAYMKIHAQRNS